MKEKSANFLKVRFLFRFDGWENPVNRGISDSIYRAREFRIQEGRRAVDISGLSEDGISPGGFDAIGVG